MKIKELLEAHDRIDYAEFAEIIDSNVTGLAEFKLKLEDQFGEKVEGSNKFNVLSRLVKKNGWVGKVAKLRGAKATAKSLCYYNSLDYVRSHDDVELAYGIFTDASNVRVMVDNCAKVKAGRADDMHEARLDMVVHAFCVGTDGIHDPTIRKQGYYAYEVIPREVWLTFEFMEDDKDSDASDFFDWVKAKAKG